MRIFKLISTPITVMYYYLVIFVSIVVSTVPVSSTFSRGAELISELNEEIDSINDLMIRVQRYLRVSGGYDSYSKSYDDVIERAEVALHQALSLLERVQNRYRKSIGSEIEGDRQEKPHFRKLHTRRNEESNWNEDFYKVLSRILKKEFSDEPLVENNVFDSMAPLNDVD